MTRFLLVPLFVLSFALALAASPGRPPDTRTLSPYFFVKSDDPSTDRLPLKSTSAAVDIVGVIARVKVTQVYRNEGQHALEAIYVFPGSTRAAVHGMTMTIGERVITARIEERQEARRQYAQALQSGRTASLLEQQRPNVFQMNVANILPGDEIKVELIYSELLVPERGSLRVRLPDGGRAAVLHHRRARRRRSPSAGCRTPTCTRASRRRRRSTSRRASRPACRCCTSRRRRTRSRWSIALTRPSRASVTPRQAGLAHARTARQRRSWSFAPHRRGRQPRRRPALPAGRMSGSKTGVLLGRGPGRERLPLHGRTAAPLRRRRRPAARIRLHHGRLRLDERLPHRDVEGAAAQRCSRSSRPQDFFNVLFFSGGTWVLSTTSLAATEGNKAWALQEIERQQGGGGTELLPALRQAFDLPRARADVSRAVVIATDGYVNVEREAFALIREPAG